MLKIEQKHVADDLFSAMFTKLVLLYVVWQLYKSACSTSYINAIEFKFLKNIRKYN